MNRLLVLNKRILNIEEIEWWTTRRQSVVPYGLMIRTYTSDAPPTDGFSSPLDEGPEC